MIDAVLSYHADPISCGVTKFSQQLAKRLDVPWGSFETGTVKAGPSLLAHNALLSLKVSEIPPHANWFSLVNNHQFDLFLHDRVWNSELLARARRVFVANSGMADDMRGCRPDVISAWCPSLVDAQPREPITVLSFGMANKICIDLYATLKQKLDETGEDYVVYVSAALHAGTSFADASQSFETLRALFGRNFVFLGTLSDEAMVDRLRSCTYVAAFFDKGLRENNTSVMAALEHGARVLTNHDAHTPADLRLWTSDVSAICRLPHHQQRHNIRLDYGWDKLVELIRHA